MKSYGKSDNQQFRSPSISPTKTVASTSQQLNSEPDILPENSRLQEMQEGMTKVFRVLQTDSKDFNPETAFVALLKYVKTHRRILYSTISIIVYELVDRDNTDSGTVKFGNFFTNIEKLEAYVCDDKNISKHKTAASTKDEKTAVDDAKKAVWKIWDHVNLAQHQYDILGQSDSEYDEKFEKRIDKFRNRLMGEMNSQLMTTVGIFTALAFILFGGISSFQSIFAGLKDIPLLKLLILACCWGLGMINIMFVFLFCIGKMTKTNFKSNMSPSATFWQRYPVIFLTNCILVSLLCVLMWLYYCLSRDAGLWLDFLLKEKPVATSIIGTIIVFIAVGFASFKTIQLIKASVGDEDE